MTQLLTISWRLMYLDFNEVGGGRPKWGAADSEAGDGDVVIGARLVIEAS